MINYFGLGTKTGLTGTFTFMLGFKRQAKILDLKEEGLSCRGKQWVSAFSTQKGSLPGCVLNIPLLGFSPGFPEFLCFTPGFHFWSWWVSVSSYSLCHSSSAFHSVSVGIFTSQMLLSFLVHCFPRSLVPFVSLLCTVHFSRNYLPHDHQIASFFLVIPFICVCCGTCITSILLFGTGKTCWRIRVGKQIRMSLENNTLLSSALDLRMKQGSKSQNYFKQFIFGKKQKFIKCCKGAYNNIKHS